MNRPTLNPLHRAAIDRLREKYIEDPNTGCWNWTAALDTKGYGTFAMTSQRKVHAYRASYTLLVGDVPKGLVLDHLCRNRRCVNPAHLEPVTVRENLMRGETKAAQNAAKTHCAHGHPFTADNLLKRQDGRRKCRECNRQYLARRRQNRSAA